MDKEKYFRELAQLMCQKPKSGDQLVYSKPKSTSQTGKTAVAPQIGTALELSNLKAAFTGNYRTALFKLRFVVNDTASILHAEVYDCCC